MSGVFKNESLEDPALNMSLQPDERARELALREGRDDKTITNGERRSGRARGSGTKRNHRKGNKSFGNAASHAEVNRLSDLCAIRMVEFRMEGGA